MKYKKRQLDDLSNNTGCLSCYIEAFHLAHLLPEYVAQNCQIINFD